jgi:RHS repeat-associated protein
VLATITDRKIPVDSDPDSLVDFYRADIITADDYYPFGMQMPSRHWQADSADQYRFGFNGKEKDNAWNGQGNTYNFGARSYAPRLGRNLSPDEYQPFAYPGVTPYSGHNNNPIANVDINGELILYFGGWWPLRGDGEAALDYWNDELIRKTSHKLKDPAVMGFSGSDDIFSEASDRRLAGYLKGLRKAQQIHDQLMRQRKNGDANAKINVVAHSMGAAYSQGFIKALTEAKDSEGNALFNNSDFNTGFLLAPYQAEDVSMKNLPIVAHQFDYGSDIFSLFGGNVEGANTKTKGGFEIGILGGHKQNQLEEMFNFFVPSNWSIDPKQKGNGSGNDDGGEMIMEMEMMTEVETISVHVIR